jgi:hypothetical protein
MGEHERLCIRAECFLSDGVVACQRVPHGPAERFVLDFRARHVAAMHQHIGVPRQPVDALAGDRIAADGDDLALGFKPVAVAGSTASKTPVESRGHHRERRCQRSPSNERCRPRGRASWIRSGE